MKKNKQNADHYIWGDNCDGWRLVQTEGLSIIHERMPACTSEVRHYHHKARQFFFVLSGCLTLEMDGDLYELSPQEGLEIPPLAQHRVMNRSDAETEFLVISQPASRGDRVTV